METVKDKIQRIKMARMGPEYQFIAKLFSDLVPHKTKSKPGHVFFLLNDIPVIAYDKKAHYLWCHYDNIWTPFKKIVESNLSGDENRMTDSNTVKHMRVILNHFSLGYFDISNATFSMAHSFITKSWETLKFKRVYVW